MSPAFLATLRGSHQIDARAFVLDSYQTGVAPVGTEIPILAGQVTVDGTANIRSTLDLTTDGTGMWPVFADALLAPYGNEVFVQRGVKFGNGSTEWCSLGYFRIQTPGQDTPPDGPIRLDGRDRMAGLIDGRLLAPAQFMSTDTYGDVVDQLVTAVYPSATIQWDDATNAQTLGRAVIVEVDRFAFLNDLIKSVGKIWYWDHRGYLLIRDQPDPTAPVFEVNSGEGGVLVSMARNLTRERVYNAMVASGEAADTSEPVTAVAIDDNPDSPTYFYGRFGPVPEFYSSPMITTVTQAQTAADAALGRKLGLPYSVDFTAIPNPALEPYDSIRIRYTNRAAAENHILQKLTVPLTENATMSGGTREQTNVLIGSL